jgi:hypothetical protein
MVALPYAHGRLSIFGDIKAVQSWSINLTFVAGDFSSGTLLSAFLVAVRPAITTWWSAAGSAGSLNASDCRLLGSRAYYYSAGEGNAHAQAEDILTSPLSGTGANPLPTQTSLVCSLLTAFPGRRNRGRLYVPMNGKSLATGHQLTTGEVTSVANTMKALIDGVNAQLLGSATCRVVVGSNQPTPPVVTKVRVDNEPDVQRRRADKILATSFALATIA